jgi:hypothetical protein
MIVLFTVTVVLLLLAGAVTRYGSDAERQYDIDKFLNFIQFRGQR